MMSSKTKMDNQQAEKRLNDLRAQITLHAHQYYVLDDPIIADGEYIEEGAKVKVLKHEGSRIVVERV